MGPSAVGLFRVESPLLLYGLIVPCGVLAAGFVIMGLVRRRWTTNIRATIAAVVLGVLPMASLSIGFAMVSITTANSRVALRLGGIGAVLCVAVFFLGRKEWIRIEAAERATTEQTMRISDKVVILCSSLGLLAYFAWVLLR